MTKYLKTGPASVAGRVKGAFLRKCQDGLFCDYQSRLILVERVTIFASQFWEVVFLLVSENSPI